MATQIKLSISYETHLESRFRDQERRFAPLVRELSDGYVGKTALKRALSRERAEAYAAYYGPVNALKITGIVRELRFRYPDRFNPRPVKIADIGAGPGSATAGFCLALPDWKVNALWVDSDPVWTDDLLVEPWKNSGSLEVKRQTSQLSKQTLAPAYDFVLAANVLNELEGDATSKARDLDRLLRSALIRTGIAIVVEPALRGPTRLLHGIRERLIAFGWTILAPCTGQKPCPMLRNDRDWCHETRDWRQPAYHHRIDQLSGLKKDALRYSFLAVTRGQAMEGADAARVVSEIRREKGRVRFITCGPDGISLEWDALDRVMRDTPEFARTIEELERGDLVNLPNVRGGRLSPGDGFGRLG